MRKLIFALSFLGVTFALAPVASATILSFNLSYMFSGDCPSGGEAPFARLSFDDFGGTGSVRLTMEALGIAPETEFISEWYFNFDPLRDSGDLTFTEVDRGGNTVNGIQQGNDQWKADGDGFYDICFEFAPPPGGFDSKFTRGESVVYDITATGITAGSFDYMSVGGDFQAQHSGVHVQGIDDLYSCWIGDVPEPNTLILLGLLLAGAGGVGFRRQRSAR